MPRSADPVQIHPRNTLATAPFYLQCAPYYVPGIVINREITELAHLEEGLTRRTIQFPVYKCIVRSDQAIRIPFMT